MAIIEYAFFASCSRPDHALVETKSPALFTIPYTVTLEVTTVAPEAFQKWGHKFRRKAPEKKFNVPPTFS